MSEGLQSLVAPLQDELFDGEQLPIGQELLLPEHEQAARFTAERVALNQQRYRSIVTALSEGLPVRTICKVWSVSHHTLKVIREREPALIATEKQRLSRLLGYGIRLCAEGVVEDLELGVPHWDSDGNVTYRPVPTNIKSISLGILSDKKAMLDGEATTVIHHVSSKLPSIEEMRRVLEAIPPANGAKPVLEIPSESGMESGMAGTESGLGLSASGLEIAEAGATDCQSGEKGEETP